VTLIKTDKT